MNKNLLKGDTLIKHYRGLEFVPSLELKAVPGLTFANDDRHHWYVATLDGRQIAACGLLILGPDTGRYKTAVVLPEFRGQGLYSMLFSMREALARSLGIIRITTYSNQQSRPKCIKEGFLAEGKESSTGVLYMAKSFDQPIKVW